MLAIVYVCVDSVRLYINLWCFKNLFCLLCSVNLMLQMSPDMWVAGNDSFPCPRYQIGDLCYFLVRRLYTSRLPATKEIPKAPSVLWKTHPSTSQIKKSPH